MPLRAVVLLLLVSSACATSPASGRWRLEEAALWVDRMPKIGSVAPRCLAAITLRGEAASPPGRAVLEVYEGEALRWRSERPRDPWQPAGEPGAWRTVFDGGPAALAGRRVTVVLILMDAAGQRSSLRREDVEVITAM